MSMLRDFDANCRGGVAVAFGLAVMVLGLFVGLAIDAARIYNITLRIQVALDAAALAGAKWMAEHDGDAENARLAAYNSFIANSAGLPIGEVGISDFSAVPNVATSTVDVGVRVRVPATLAQLAGINAFNVHKTAATSFQLARIEVVLALDVTGSMNDIPPGDSIAKLQALKTAATGLVNSLYNEATNDSNVRISLVPWSSGVLAGDYTATVSGSASGNGCLAERAGDGATSDSLPGSTTYAVPLPASSIALGYACPSVTVAPLKGRLEAETLKGKINSLTAAGGTAGHLGAAWAWWMLSPSWAAVHPAGSKPEPASANVVKAAVIMTDGVFNTSHVGGVLSSGAGSYSEESYTMFKTLCEGMRSQGIRVYTVAFDLTDTHALSKLEECAGANALTAANSSQLNAVFKSIATDLNAIRVVR